MKPEFWTSYPIARLPETTALHFIGLFNYVQDNGVGRDDPLLIRAALYALRPKISADEVDSRQCDLADEGLIVRYEADGLSLFYIAGWKEHQVIRKPAHCRYPLPPEDALVREKSALGQEKSALVPESSVTEQGTGNREREQGTGSMERGSGAAGAADQEEPPMARVMGALRRFAYFPDGKPPADWSDRRDASIAAVMFKRGTRPNELVDVIEGARLAVEDGAFQDWTPPVKPGDKFTLRLLYHTHSGVLPTWTVALNALDARWKANGARKPSGPVALGSALGGATRAFKGAA